MARTYAIGPAVPKPRTLLGQAKIQNLPRFGSIMNNGKNPHPELEIESLDFASEQTKCAPFLIAITAE